MNLSAIAGVPAAGTPMAVWPGDWSVTLPWMVTALPPPMVALTVVSDLPLPKQYMRLS